MNGLKITEVPAGSIMVYSNPQQRDELKEQGFRTVAKITKANGAKPAEDIRPALQRREAETSGSPSHVNVLGSKIAIRATAFEEAMDSGDEETPFINEILVDEMSFRSFSPDRETYKMGVHPCKKGYSPDIFSALYKDRSGNVNLRTFVVSETETEGVFAFPWLYMTSDGRTSAQQTNLQENTGTPFLAGLAKNFDLDNSKDINKALDSAIDEYKKRGINKPIWVSEEYKEAFVHNCKLLAGATTVNNSGDRTYYNFQSAIGGTAQLNLLGGILKDTYAQVPVGENGEKLWVPLLSPARVAASTPVAADAEALLSTLSGEENPFDGAETPVAVEA